ncbi:PREDICTED: trigger factor-like protein TIG, Chloroplastic [Tarenaya hassleriana]|uniref:trigger factor-like protein TIG, Chloroplastic n=1 Tax=Tarenaya hassleriana TaxID=28532 RepID=UPI00053C39E8|nr:PREDICTED: trigger factor-like protein TIG, Chloroplastic [Tarenaya hassleriana]XP_010545242.1 PREDICTED: trigger factor-like protein TIG, Chloroplastic [Tarenaya hassleriana]XP_010545243.1 PREDICTED: trigger factor-like protein TIG, Chloroplastic [Tarenaya hassleriana]XP_010545244.1 PREDICTED: trigger factor-like protein TIG, Chloroplastic [Tarenaya hassleriana]
MELCVMNSAATKLNLFSSSCLQRNRSPLFCSYPLFLSCNGSVSRFGGKLSSIRPLELSCVSNRIRFFGESSCHGSSFRRFAASSAVDAGVEEDRLPADLQVTETVEPNSRVRLSVEVPPVVCEDCYKQVIKEFMKRSKVPGFRPGKVPESILVGYIGKQHVQSAVVESILKRTLPHAVSSVTGRALKDSIRIATNFAEMEKIFTSSNILRYDVVVDVAPEIRWNPEDGYKNLKVVVEIDSDIDAKQACEKEIRQRHKSLGALKIITDRGLQVGDLVVIDISATTIGQDGSDGQNIPDAESKGFHFDTEDGDKVLPGFLDSIIGIRPGEKKSFPLVFPDTWKQENLRGLHAQFTVECKELFYRDLPPLDDSLAEKLLPGCTTLKEVEEAMLQQLQEMEQNAKEQAADNAILDQLRKMVEVEIPQSLFEEQGRQFYGARLLEIQAKMKLSEEQLASLSSPKAVNEFLQTQRESITNVIKQNLAVGDIFKRENLEFSTDELVKEVENSIAEFKKHKQEYDEERVKDQVQDILEGAKVLEWLKERAEVQYTTR